MPDALLPAETPRSTVTNRSSTRAKLSNADPLTDPKKRELQHRCHHEYVFEGLSYRAIGARLGIDEQVASAYVRIEAERRAVVREQSLAAEVDRSIAIYNDVGRRALLRMDQPGARGDEARWVLQARERVDKLLGLEAAIKIKDETPPAGPLIGISMENVTAILGLAIQAKP